MNSLFSELDRLYILISAKESDNQDEILKTLDSLKNPKDVINQIRDDESLLMWAVWNLREEVVKKLVELGADVHWSNDYGQSAATYWDFNLYESNRSTCPVRENQELVLRIVTILHKAGADLSLNAPKYTKSIIKKVRTYQEKYPVLYSGFV